MTYQHHYILTARANHGSLRELHYVCQRP